VVKKNITMDEKSIMNVNVLGEEISGVVIWDRVLNLFEMRG
jgi:hypothetical protein